MKGRRLRSEGAGQARGGPTCRYRVRKPTWTCIQGSVRVSGIGPAECRGGYGSTTRFERELAERVVDQIVCRPDRDVDALVGQWRRSSEALDAAVGDGYLSKYRALNQVFLGPGSNASGFLALGACRRRGQKHWARPISKALNLEDGRLTFHVLEAPDPADALVSFAQRNQVDHIVMGARGNSILRRYLGSVSSTVVAESLCTVTVVRATAPDDDRNEE